MANGRVSYNGRERYEKLMVFGGVPVYSTNSDILVTKADVACCLDRAIVIRTEALEALRSSPRSRKFLKTILDHAIKYGPGHSSSEHDERTPEEKEVDAFLQNLGYFN